jgi:hypothetical protein
MKLSACTPVESLQPLGAMVLPYPPDGDMQTAEDGKAIQASLSFGCYHLVGSSQLFVNENK